MHRVLMTRGAGFIGSHLAEALIAKRHEVFLLDDLTVFTIEDNVRGRENILAAVARGNVGVLLTSTSEVYGKSDRACFREDDDLIIGPPSFGRWSYACSKLLDEFLALAYWREKELPLIGTRLFNTVSLR